MNNAKHALLKKGIPLFAGTAMLLAGQVASAANITVRVVDAATHQPVSGAAVCLGSSTQPVQFGSSQTNAQGEVVYARAPRSEFVLSVAGEQGDYVRTLTPRNFDIVYVVELKNSADNSFCLAPTKRPQSVQGRSAMDLVSVDVRSHSHGGGTVDVATSVKGLAPTHIRASTDASFKGARWLPYRVLTRHQINRVSSENLYVQVKRAMSVEGGSAEAISDTSIGDLHWD